MIQYDDPYLRNAGCASGIIWGCHLGATFKCAAHTGGLAPSCRMRIEQHEYIYRTSPADFGDPILITCFSDFSRVVAADPRDCRDAERRNHVFSGCTRHITFGLMGNGATTPSGEAVYKSSTAFPRIFVH